MTEHVAQKKLSYVLAPSAITAGAPLLLEARRTSHSQVFGRGTHAAAVAALVLADVLAFCAAIGLAGALSWFVSTQVFNAPYEAFNPASFRGQLWLWCSLTAALCTWFAVTATYTSRRSFEEDAKRAITASFIIVIIGGFVEFAAKEDFSRLWVMLIFPCAAALIPAGRIAVRRMLSVFGLWRMGAAILGNGQRYGAVFESLERDRYVGYYPAYHANLISQPDQPLPELAAEISAAMHVRGAETAILVPSPSEMQHLDRVIDALNLNLVPYILVPPVQRLPFAGLSVQTFFNSSLILMTSRTGLISPMSRALKRAFDVVISAALLVFLMPALLLIAALVASSGWPILYGHQRVGRARRSFRCLKFRSMVTNSEQVLQELLARDPVAAAEWRQNFKLTKDPRITSIGRFLRKTSLDELPQLINVLRGEMSLVGPRPVIAKEIAQYYGEEAFYYELVRPGVTGLWQVSGRSTTSYARRVFLDAHYVRNWSMWTDISILFHTIPSVLAGKGAV